MKIYLVSVLSLLLFLTACNEQDSIIVTDTEPVKEEPAPQTNNSNTNTENSNTDSNNPDNNNDNSNNNTSETFTGISVNNALQLVNALRTQGCTCGNKQMPPVSAVTWNNQLALAALSHSTDMLDNDFFSHRGSDGSTPGDRISRTGYRWYTFGENIAYNYPDLASVIQGWKDSPSHCENIMNPDFKEMGLAKVGPYWTQTFASGR